MKTLSKTPWTAALLLGLALGAGCGGDSHGHDDGGGHAHAAPHAEIGGFLVELGDHYAQLEIVHDRGAGELRFYVYDGHAESAVRLEQEAIELELELTDGPLALTAAAQASDLTGETVGDSSEFLAADPRLKGLRTFSGTVREIDVRGETFSDVAFRCPPEDAE